MMKKLIILLFALCSTIILWANGTEINGIHYILEGDSATVTYTGSDINDSYNSSKFYKGAITIPSTVTYSGIIYRVTMIGSHAFQNSTSLTSVTIPNSVTSIGGCAFEFCSGLTSVTIPNSVTSIGNGAFSDCKGLTSITIGNSVTSIGNRAFWYCTSLTSLNIPNSVTSIGDDAFEYCTGLTAPIYSDYVFAYMPTTYSGAYTIPSTIKIIANCAFKDCSNLTSVTIPNSVTSIGNRAFWYCTSLTSLNIPNSVTTIGEKAFYYTQLMSITIPNGVTSIGYQAFGSCIFLATVNWNAKNAADCSTPFYESDFVTSFIFGDSVEHIPTHLCYGLDRITSITIPNSVTSIGDEAFHGCTGLTSITIPNSVTSIGEGAFKGCKWLKSAIIPNGVSSIKSSTFSGCTNLSSVVIGTGVTSVGESAFEGCTKLLNITCYPVNPPTVNSYSFANYNVYLKVPCDNLMAYQTDAIWGNFKYIQCIGSEESTATDFTITGGDSDATFQWPTNSSANSYTMTITKDGVVFCTLTFNANGQLMNIAFAPSRGANNAQQAEQTASGYKFTVTGLDAASQYGYTFKALDSSNQALATYTGTFNTEGYVSALEDVKSNSNIQKYIHNGKLYILRNGQTYDASGREVK